MLHCAMELIILVDGELLDTAVIRMREWTRFVRVFLFWIDDFSSDMGFVGIVNCIVESATLVPKGMRSRNVRRCGFVFDSESTEGRADRSPDILANDFHGFFFAPSGESSIQSLNWFHNFETSIGDMFPLPMLLYYFSFRQLLLFLLVTQSWSKWMATIPKRTSGR